MKKLRIILQCKWFYYIFLISAFIFSLWQINKPLVSNYNEDDTYFKGIITSIKRNNYKVSIEIKAKEVLRGEYFLKDNESFLYEIGDIIEINGKLKKPSHNTVPNLFDYADYLKIKGESWLLEIETIKNIGKSNNVFIIIKRYIYRKLESYSSYRYLKTFLLGDQSDLDSSIITTYRDNGISHLFSISGMHISFLSGIFILIMNKIKFLSKLSYVFTCLLLVFYMFLVGCSASIVRACIFFILRYIFLLLKLEIPVKYIFLFMISLVLYIIPSFIVDIGFQYSTVISFFLLTSHFSKSNNYLVNLLKVSIFSFFISLPISLYYFYQVNFFSVLYNLIFVPYVSLIVFPLSFITFIFPSVDFIFSFLTNLMEKLSYFLSTVSWGKVNFIKPSLWWIIIYYIFLFFNYKKYYIKVFILIFIVYLYFYPLIFPQEKVLIIDVGQGDSILIQSNKKSILIDTGGNFLSSSNSISERILVPLLKSKGIKSLNYLILTHGDYDHMGEAINLVNNFKVEKVIFNCGEYNDLEKELIRVLNKNNIKYYSCIKELNLDKYKLQFLNTKEYDNENDNSNVIYFNYNNYKFLFMGDAGIEREKDILDKYNLKEITFLKLGHHGSNTSSSKYFIDSINSKYSLISVGKNNRYGHPKDSVLDILKKSIIYRTDKDGSIEIELNKNGYNIRTCSP